MTVPEEGKHAVFCYITFAAEQSKNILYWVVMKWSKRSCLLTLTEGDRL